MPKQLRSPQRDSRRRSRGVGKEEHGRGAMPPPTRTRTTVMKSSNQATPEGEEVDVRTPLKLSLQTFENGSQRRRARRPTRLAIRVAAAVCPLLNRGSMSSMCCGARLAAIVFILLSLQ